MSDSELSFAQLGLPASLLSTLSALGYETPTPIQQATIPQLLTGQDVVGMAQTGTGKTAAFALPILAKIDIKQQSTQALVLCPTRELAIQVAEAFQSYAAHLPGFHVLPIYGGADMRGQLRSLQRGVHVIVATPGRLLDHLDRKSLNLGQLKTLVMDEADEMLRMGFIDDVETILEKTPKTRQVVLFSATMPRPIRQVAEKYLKDPQEVRTQSAATTNENIEQHFWLVTGTNKLDALTRILEVEEFDGMIIFVRTKTSTTELADKLSARGYSVSALNGDMNQQLRQRTVDQLKRGQLDILVATDVAARGLDVERVSHIINYDIPYDDETYVHRIGRTGRAGRSGKAILFVAPRERHLLRSIERTTRKSVTQMSLPSRADLIDKRSKNFQKKIVEAMTGDADFTFFNKLIDEICQAQVCSPVEVAAAMAFLLQKDRPLQPKYEKLPDIREDDGGQEERFPRRGGEGRGRNSRDGGNRDSGGRGDYTRERAPRDFTRDSNSGRDNNRSGERKPSSRGFSEGPVETYRIDVGHNDSVSPREIVGAIANEAGIPGKNIGNIRIFNEYTTVELPVGVSKSALAILKKTRVRSRPLNIERSNETSAHAASPPAARRKPSYSEGGASATGKDTLRLKAKPRREGGSSASSSKGAPRGPRKKT